MTKKIATISGWAQPHDALASVAPDALHVDYTRHTNLETALEEEAKRLGSASTIIGWSLGGYIAAEMVARKLIAPEKLILIATSYQFVANDKFKAAMGRDTYKQFQENFRSNPPRTFKKSYQLIALGDKRAEMIQPILQRNLQRLPDRDWGYWLDLLEHTSCAAMDFSHFPETHIIHGQQDAVVSVDQAHHLAQVLPSAQLHVWENCGHAPHWHNAEAIRKLI